MHRKSQLELIPELVKCGEVAITVNGSGRHEPSADWCVEASGRIGAGSDHLEGSSNTPRAFHSHRF